MMEITSNNNTISPEQVSDEIIQLFQKYGDEDYDGEPVSQASHMTQSAMQAIKENATNELVIGAFLHDIGHLLKHGQQTEERRNERLCKNSGVMRKHSGTYRRKFSYRRFSGAHF